MRRPPHRMRGDLLFSSRPAVFRCRFGALGGRGATWPQGVGNSGSMARPDRGAVRRHGPVFPALSTAGPGDVPARLRIARARGRRLTCGHDPSRGRPSGADAVSGGDGGTPRMPCPASAPNSMITPWPCREERRPDLSEGRSGPCHAGVPLLRSQRWRRARGCRPSAIARILSRYTAASSRPRSRCRTRCRSAASSAARRRRSRTHTGRRHRGDACRRAVSYNAPARMSSWSTAAAVIMTWAPRRRLPPVPAVFAGVAHTAGGGERPQGHRGGRAAVPASNCRPLGHGVAAQRLPAEGTTPSWTGRRGERTGGRVRCSPAARSTGEGPSATRPDAGAPCSS